MGCASVASTPAVLVVEDNWQIARSIRRWLEEAALQVLGPAPTLAQAEKVLDMNTPDVAVVDLNLQGEFSYPLIERLEAEDVKVIVITAYDEASRDLKKGAFVLEKPFSRESLLEAIRERAFIQ